VTAKLCVSARLAILRRDGLNCAMRPGRHRRCLPQPDRATVKREQAWFKAGWLLLGSGVVTCPSRHQTGDERSEQGFAASACVVHELEEAGVVQNLPFLGYTRRAETAGL